MASGEWYKNNPGDLIWWLESDDGGQLAFSFDRKTVLYLFQDYKNLTPEQRAIFDRENPYWAKFFSRQED